VAHFIGGLVVVAGLVLTAWPGVKYGIPFPVLARSSFGSNGAQFCTLTRGAVAVLWLSFQTWQGALGIYTSVGAVAGDAFLEWGRIDSNVTWGQILIMIAYVLLHCGVIRAGLKRFQLLIYILSPLQVLLYGGILAWACTIAPLTDSLATETVSTGGTYGWIVAINASVATWSTLILNVADLSRFCPTQKDQILGQSLGIPFPFAITGWIGMVAAGATSLVYGVRLWQIPEYFQHWPAGWALAGGILNALSILSVNVMANLLSPMNDILNVAPNRLNFRACGYLCMVLSMVLCPWYLFASDTAFVTTFLNGYGMVTGALAGILITDFWIVRRCHLVLQDLYPAMNLGAAREGSLSSANWRAFVATLVGVVPCVPGFLSTLGIRLNSKPLELLYAFSWFFAMFVSGTVYWALMTIWPPAGLRPGAASFASMKELELGPQMLAEEANAEAVRVVCEQ